MHHLPCVRRRCTPGKRRGGRLDPRPTPHGRCLGRARQRPGGARAAGFFLILALHSPSGMANRLIGCLRVDESVAVAVQWRWPAAQAQSGRACLHPEAGERTGEAGEGMGGAQGACPQIGAGSKRAATAWSGARRRPTAACRQCRVAGLPACTGIASLACTGSASPPPPPPPSPFPLPAPGGSCMPSGFGCWGGGR